MLKEYGGLYLDTDVELYGSIDNYINHLFVIGIENLLVGTDKLNDFDEKGYIQRSSHRISGFGINTGFIYARPHHQVIDSMIDIVYMGGGETIQKCRWKH